MDPLIAMNEKYEQLVEKRLREWAGNDFVNRVWRKDPTIWSPEGSPVEIVDRLGWLSLPEFMRDQVDGISAFAGEIKSEGYRHVVLLGMGGSSLAPAVFQDTFGNPQEYPELIVLDSTHPAAIKAVEDKIEPLKTLFLVSSKSGTTLETSSLFAFFWDRISRLTADPGRSFVAITDSGSSLAKLAEAQGFRRTFSAPADVGGRYSALTVFGLVPAALIGVDIRRLVEHSLKIAQASRSPKASQNPGSVLGAILGELGLSGRDKITFVVGSEFASFPLWLEQLIAESTGKNGKGLVPVAGETLGPPNVYGNDRVFIGISLAQHTGKAQEGLNALQQAGHPVIRFSPSELGELGSEMYRWEFATAAAGSILQINPFDQPDVQLAKDLARKAMEQKGDQATGAVTSVSDSKKLSEKMEKLTGGIRAGDYIALQAYLAPTAQISNELENLRNFLRDRLHVATTVGFGPRFLHSTGQLHKGGPASGVFIQLVDRIVNDLETPGKNYTFGKLIRAQADGDCQALRTLGRRILKIDLGENASSGLAELMSLLK